MDRLATEDRRNRIQNVDAVYLQGSAVPAGRPRQPVEEPRVAPKPRVVRKSREQLIRETRRSRALAFRFLAVAVVMFTLIGFQIYSKVRCDNLDRQLADIQEQIEIVESDNARLNLELNANVSLDQVEAYATNTLGMVKVADSQIHYVKLADSDTIEVSGGKIHKSFGERLKSLFN